MARSPSVGATYQQVTRSYKGSSGDAMLILSEPGIEARRVRLCSWFLDGDEKPKTKSDPETPKTKSDPETPASALTYPSLLYNLPLVLASDKLFCRHGRIARSQRSRGLPLWLNNQFAEITQGGAHA